MQDKKTSCKVRYKIQNQVIGYLVNVQDVNLRKLYCKRIGMSRKKGASCRLL